MIWGEQRGNEVTITRHFGIRCRSISLVSCSITAIQGTFKDIGHNYAKFVNFMACILHTAGISNVDSILVNFELGRRVEKYVKLI